MAQIHHSKTLLLLLLISAGTFPCGLHAEAQTTATDESVAQQTKADLDALVERWNNRELRADSFVTFDLNPDGSIDRVRMKAVSAATDFSFDFHDLLLEPK